MLLIWLLCLVPAALCVQYRDLEFLGQTCPGRDNCTSMFANATSDFRFRNCECDNACAAFGDCCVDAPSAVPPGQHPVLQCMPFGTDPSIGAYVVSGCPRGAEPALRRKCEGGPDWSDPFLAAPVSSPNGGPTYPNAYCAACNGAPLDRLVRWELLVSCESLAPYNVSSSYIWAGLRQAEDGAWVVDFEEQEHTCDILFDRPHSVRRLRLCRAGLVGDCPRDWRRENVRELCASYTAVVHSLRASYRNPHCALCNGANMRGLVCDPSQLLFGKSKIFTFAHIFDVAGEGDVGRDARSCTRDQKFDPVTKTCRNLVCALPGYVRRGNKCVKN